MNGKLLRIFVGETDKWQNQPLYEAIVLLAKNVSVILYRANSA